MSEDTQEQPIPASGAEDRPAVKDDGFLGGLLGGMLPGAASSSTAAAPSATNPLGLPSLPGVPNPVGVFGEDAPAPPASPAPAAPPPGGVALSQLSGIPAMDAAPASCQQVLNAAIPGCQPTDFHAAGDATLGQQSKCSQTCQNGLGTQLAQLQQQCSVLSLPGGSPFGNLASGSEAAILCKVATLLGLQTSTSAASSTLTSVSSPPSPPPAPPPVTSSTSTSAPPTSQATEASAASAPSPLPPPPLSASSTTSSSTSISTTTQASSSSAVAAAPPITTTVPLVLSPETQTILQTSDVFRTSTLVITATASQSAYADGAPPSTAPTGYGVNEGNAGNNSPSPTPITSTNAPSPVPAVLGIVFGVMAVLAVGGLFGFLFVRKRKRRTRFTEGKSRMMQNGRQYRSPVTGRTIYPYMSGVTVRTNGDRNRSRRTLGQPAPSRSALSLVSSMYNRARDSMRYPASKDLPRTNVDVNNSNNNNNNLHHINNPFDDVYSIPEVPDLPDMYSDTDSDLESGLRAPLPTLARTSTTRSFRTIRSYRSTRSARSNRSYRSDATGMTDPTGRRGENRDSAWSTRSRSLVFMLGGRSVRKSNRSNASPENGNSSVRVTKQDPFADHNGEGNGVSLPQKLSRLNAWLESSLQRERPESTNEKEGGEQENEGVRTNMVSKLRAAAMRRKGY